MSPISKQVSKIWSERQSELKGVINELQHRDIEINAKIVGQPLHVVAIRRLELANLSMDMLSYYIVLADLCKVLTKVKNENYVNEARKLAYKSIIYLENVVTNYIDVPFSDYKDQLLLIQTFPDNERLKLMNKLGLSIQLVIDSLGENSKWKWSYSELRGRYAVVLKNIIDLKKYNAEFDPRSSGYQERIVLMMKTKQFLSEVADMYRQKYELTTQRLDDMKMALQFLGALKRIHAILSEAEDADEIGKKIDVWKAKMEDDERRQDQLDKKNPVAKNQEKNKKKKSLFGF